MDRRLGATPAFGSPWSSLNPPLTPWVAEVIDKMGFTNMTPVQAGTIPRAMKNQDCVVEAVTGSGKTLAFVVPVLERMCRREEKYKKGEVGATIIAPTRELAQQIHDVIYHFLASLIPPPPPPGARSDPSSSRSPSPPPPQPPAPYPLPSLITSGTQHPYETFQSLGSSILVGTPGRLASFLLSPRGIASVRVSELDVLVLDEADRLLSAPDHRRDVERIMRHLPKQRRTHLFSATMTDAVEELVGLGLRNPVRIVVNLKDKRKGEAPTERRTPTGLQNTFLICRHAEKTLQLVRLLQYEAKVNEAAKFIVYFSTCAAVDYFYRILSRLPSLSTYHLTSLYGDLPPRIRATALSTFQTHPSSHLTPSILLCTDVAARGVDFPDIDVVIQYDAPTDPKTFSHRAGRTARAGKRGKGVTLLGKGREEDYVEFLRVRKIPLTRQAYIGEDMIEVDRTAEEMEKVDEGAKQLMAQIREIALSDRELADKGAKAYVSSLRACSKHEASFIFRLADLDLGEVATAFGLLRLPVMPEIKDWKKKRDKAAQAGEILPVQWEDADVDWETFAYASKTREAARLATLEKRKLERLDPVEQDERRDERRKRKIRAEMREAWSVQKERKGRREERREKKDKRKQAEWERTQAENGEVVDGAGGQDVGESKKQVGSAAVKKEKKVEEDEDGSGAEEMDKDWKALRKEVKGEKGLGKGRRDVGKAADAGMFGDLD